MDQTDSDQRGGREDNGGKKGKGSQTTCRNGLWMWPTVWGLTMGAGGGMSEEGKGGKIETTVIE